MRVCVVAGALTLYPSPIRDELLPVFCLVHVIKSAFYCQR